MLTELLLTSVERAPGMLAVEDPTVGLTYKRLATLARVMRDTIERETDNPRVAVMLPASASFAGCLFGAFWAGRICVPLNFLLSPTELQRIVAAAGVDVVFTIRHFHELAESLPVRKIYLDQLPLKRRMIVAGLRRLPKPPSVGSDDTAVLLFTSGTSGDPKGVELTQNNLRSNSIDCIETAGMQPNHRFLNCLPPFHVFGLTCDVILPIALGASVYCIPRFSPMAFAKTFAEKRISIALAIPSMFNTVLRLKSAAADLFKDSYILMCGGEPLSDALRDQFQERFGERLLQGYGMSEASPVCAMELPEAHRAGTIGRPVRHVAIRVVDPDGQPVDTGAEGELWIKGPNVMKGYYNDPEATRKTITPDGWLKTGDGGKIDADGFVTITGRLKDLIIVGGENVYPREIEAVLEGHESVAEVAVVGAPDPSRGEVPVAFVILKEGLAATESELREFARSALAGYKCPRKVTIAEDLPRGPTGKILKRKLRERL